VNVFLGIDPGFHVTGYAIIRSEPKKAFLVDCGYLQMSPKKHLSERVGEFHTFFTEKITTLKVTHIALETSFLGKNAQTFLKLGYLRGILYLLAHTHSLALHEFSPSQVKSTISGKGGASKEQIAQLMLSIFPDLLNVKAVAKNDVTDALAICLCGVHSHLYQQKMAAHLK
jgi:crossover junction endodeoxyribonuclease RuvC